MAKEKSTPAIDDTGGTPVEAAFTPPVEPTYTAKEFAAYALSAFGHNSDIVAAALKHAKFESGTIAEAKTIIDRFAGRKVQ